MKPIEIRELEKHLEIKLTEVNHLESISNFLEKMSDNESSYLLNHMDEIIYLRLSNVKINRGKDYFKKIQNLKIVYFYFFGYSYIDETSNEDYSFLGELVSLELLVIQLFEPSYTTDLSFLSNLKKLRVLVAPNNQISDISFLQHLSHLKMLNLSNNKIHNYSFLQHLNRLQSLNLSNNFLQEIFFLQNLNQLQSLNLSKNLLQNISALQNLNELQSLNLSENRIEHISFLQDLYLLQKLDLSENQIHDISFLQDLKCLELLNLSGNRIWNISFLKNLTGLKNLNLSWNEVLNISILRELPALEFLYLSGNNIQEISLDFLNDLPNLKELWIDKNPLKKTNIPQEIFDNDKNVLQEVRSYLIAQAQGQIINTETKVIWFGNGEAGKTTLSHQFRENVFSEEAGKDRTHGILIKEWLINYQDSPQNLKVKIKTSIQKAKKENPQVKIPIPEQIILKLWDFGGQEYYHATHHLFLSSNVLYLLVWDEQTNFQDEDKGIYPLEYWQENIRSNAERNIIIEIQNKEKGSCSIDPAQLKHKIALRNKGDEKSIQQYKLDIEVLKEAIFNQLHHLEYLGSLFPSVYDDTRQTLRKQMQPYFLFDKYVRLCRENDFTRDKIMQDDSQIRTLTHFLHETGTIICYHYHKEDLGDLKNYVFLRPQWVTDYIYEILSKDLKDKGEFDLAHIQEKTKDSGIEAAVWKALMKEFKLIFENKTTQNFIAPQYLSKECKEQKAFNWALKANPELVFTLHFPKFLAKYLFLQFIVEYGTESIDDLYWKNGLVFSLFGKTVFATCDYANRKITIQVQDKDPKVTQELYQWFAKEIREDTEISVGGEFEILCQIKNPKFRQVYENDYWFVFGNKRLEINKINQNMLGKDKELQGLVDKLDVLINKKNYFELEVVKTADVETKFSLNIKLTELEREIEEIRQKIIALSQYTDTTKAIEKADVTLNVIKDMIQDVSDKIDKLQDKILQRFDTHQRALIEPVIQDLPENQANQLLNFYNEMPMEKMHEAVLLLAEIVHNEVILVKEDILTEMKKLMLKSSEDSIQLKSKFELGLPFLFKIEAEMNMNKYLKKLKRLIPHNLGGKLNH